MIKIKWFGFSSWKLWDENTSISTDPFVCIEYKVPENLSFHNHTDIPDTEIMSYKIASQKSNTIIFNYA